MFDSPTNLYADASEIPGIAAFRSLFKPTTGRTTRLSFSILKRGESLLALLPQNSRHAREVVELYSAQTTRARGAKMAMTIALRAGWSPRLSKLVMEVAADDPLLQLIRKEGMDICADYSFGVLAGSIVDKKQRFIFTIFGKNNKIERVLKVGCSLRARELVAHEFDLVRSLPPNTSGVADMMQLVHGKRFCAFVMNFISGTAPRQSSSAKLLAFLRKWIRPHETMALQDLPQYIRLRDQCFNPALLQLHQRLGLQKVHPVISHGDFAPWNIREDSRGEWMTLDWEQGELTGVPCWDWFHFQIQQLVLVRRLRPHEIADEVERLLQDTHFKTYCLLCGVSGFERDLLLSYLLFVIHVFMPTHGMRQFKLVFLELEKRWRNHLPHKQTSATIPREGNALQISVVTPSYNQIDWLRLCVASVRDQITDEETNRNQVTKALPQPQDSSFTSQVSSTLRVEHIIQDAGSPGIEDFAREVEADFYRDGQLVFLGKGGGLESKIQNSDSSLPELHPSPIPNYSISIYVDSDRGMYDAINRGFEKSSGEFVSWLNCDEQLLPGALRQAVDFFKSHPKDDVLFGDALLLNEKGDIISYRRSIKPTLLHTRLAHLATLSCAMFFRRTLLVKGFLLDTRWKSISDAVWVADLIENGIRMAVLPIPMGAFTMTQVNLGQSSLLFVEMESWKDELPLWKQSLWPVVIAQHRLKKMFAGAYGVHPTTTALYTRASPDRRQKIQKANASFGWPKSTSPLTRDRVALSDKLFFTSEKNGRNASFQPQTFRLGTENQRHAFWASTGILATVIVCILDCQIAALTFTPFFSSLVMLTLAFVLSPAWLFRVALILCVAVFFSLRYQSSGVDDHYSWLRIALRLGSFGIASTLAILFSLHRVYVSRLSIQMRDVLLKMPAPVVISDAYGIVKFANSMAGELLGRSPDEMVGESYILMLMSKEDADSAHRRYHDIFEKCETKSRQVSLTIGGNLKQKLTADVVSIGDRSNRLLITKIWM